MLMLSLFFLYVIAKVLSVVSEYIYINIYIIYTWYIYINNIYICYIYYIYCVVYILILVLRSILFLIRYRRDLERCDATFRDCR